MASTTSYTLRIPVALKFALEKYGETTGQSLASVLVSAGWAWVEDSGKTQNVERRSPKPKVAGIEPAAPAKPDIEALRACCARKEFGSQTYWTPDNLPPEAYAEVPICGKTWWEDGEHFECLMDAEHRESKHGQRGMIRKLDD